MKELICEKQNLSSCWGEIYVIENMGHTSALANKFMTLCVVHCPNSLTVNQRVVSKEEYLAIQVIES